jgi:hypothetical protein
MQESGLAARLSYDSSGMMAANIVEGAQSAVVSADNDNGLTGDGSADELSGQLQLIGTRDKLPGLAENAEALEFRDARVDVPGCGNSRGLR